jgi:alpha-1,2-glucosyltransferase
MQHCMQRRRLSPSGLYPSCGWVLVAQACTCAAGPNATMLRCRYFTVPFVLLALHMQPPSPRQLALMGGAYAAVDAITIYVFMFRPFAWPDGSVARFIW